MMQKRIGYIDFIKGVAILLVICGHIYGLTDHPTNFITNTIGSLHNPLFYLSSGMLFSVSSKQSDCLLDFVRGRFLALIGPFIAWIIIYTVTVGSITSSMENYVFSLYDVVNKLWFLPVLFFAQMTLYVVKKIGIPTLAFVLILGVSLIIAAFYSSFIAKIVTFTCIFFIGTLIKLCVQNKVFLLVNYLGFIIVLCLYAIGYVEIQDSYTPGFKMLIMLVGMITGGNSAYSIIVKLWNRICTFKLTGIISSIGKKSIYVYILHYMIIYYLEITADYNLIKYILAGICAIMIPILISIGIKDSFIDLLLFKPNGLCRKKEKND